LWWGAGVYHTRDQDTLLLSTRRCTALLTTSQMGWTFTRERNEITNEKDERDGKPVARQLAPMISKFIRQQWESHELECMDDERRQILEEAAELDHIWGVWAAEAELTNGPREWLKQPSLSSGTILRCTPHTVNTKVGATVSVTDSEGPRGDS